MKSYKVIITGPVGAGKTTAVHSVTDTPISTDTTVSDLTRCRKATTTVAMDYGVLHLEDKTIHVYGTPGQERFDFMWEILINGGDVLIILLDHSRHNPYRDMQHYAQCFASFMRPNNTIIGITHYESTSTINLDTYRQWATELNITPFIFLVDARNKQDILFLIHTVLESINNPVLISINHTPSIEHSDHISPVITSAMLIKMHELGSILGVSVINAQGEVEHSSMPTLIEQDITLLIHQLSIELESTMEMEVQKILLRGKKDPNIMLFKEQDQALSLLFDKKASPSLLSQQVEDILQWV